MKTLINYLIITLIATVFAFAVVEAILKEVG
jgi:hypothetical protein